jgi:hypothetical protein
LDFGDSDEGVFQRIVGVEQSSFPVEVADAKAIFLGKQSD